MNQPSDFPYPSGPFVMNNILFNHDALVGAWVNFRLRSGEITVPFRAIGILREDDEAANDQPFEDRLVAGVYFFNHHPALRGVDNITNEPFTWSKIMCAVAVDDPKAITEKSLRAILAYPFVDLKVDLITAEISLSNNNAIEQAKRLGFRQLGVLPSIRAGGEVGLFGMRRDWCPYWTEEKAAA